MYNSLYDRLYHGGKPQDTLQKSLEGLRSKDNEERVSSAKKIRRYLEQEARGRSHESFSRVLNSIIDRIEKWANTNANDRLACTILIAEIINIPNDEIVKKTVQFVNQLQIIIAQQAIGKLPSPNSSSLKALEAAAHVLGRLASGPAAATSVFVEYEIKRAIEWLSQAPEMKRYAAVLVLRELAINAPTLFNIHSDKFFESIYSTLCDSKLRIRTAAAIALRHALRVVAQRESRQKNRLYNDIYSCARDEFPPQGAVVAKPKSSPIPGRRKLAKAKSSFGSSPRKAFSMIPFIGNSSSSTSEPHLPPGAYAGPADPNAPFNFKGNNFVHGALLGLYELIGESTGEFIQYRFEEIFEGCVWREEIRLSPDPLIREATMMILPRLALHCPSVPAFNEFYKQSLDYLVQAASSDSNFETSCSSTPTRSRSGIPDSALSSLDASFEEESVASPVSSPRSGATALSPTGSSSSIKGKEGGKASSRLIRIQGRSAAFLALGQMSALDNKSSLIFPGYIVEIFKLIRDGLAISSKWPFCKEALDCMRMIMQTQEVVSHVGSPFLCTLIPLMFNGGLSESLVSTLVVLSQCIPNDVGQIQARLLQELTHILSVSAIRGGKRNRDFQNAEQEKQIRQTVKQFIHVEKSTAQNAGRSWLKRASRELQSSMSANNLQEEDETLRQSRSFRSDSMNPQAAGESGSSMKELWRDIKGMATNWLSSANGPPAPSAKRLDKEQYDKGDPDASRQLLALRTFLTFSFKGINLLPIVCAVVLRHLDSPEARVRLEACRACCLILARHFYVSRIAIEERTEAAQHILERLVLVAMVDEDVSIRRAAIEELSGKFASTLLKNVETVKSFIVLSNDQNFYVRAMAVEAIGKFATLSPSSMMPSINNVLLRLLNELNFAVDSKQREESVVLLGVLVRSVGPSLSRPHISPIINTLLPKINFVRRGVATAMLATLGEVARVGGEETLTPLFGKVLPIIVDILDDKSTATVIKRRVALDTLATLASNAAMPIWPYFCFHRLLDHILSIMVQPGSESLRKQAMITFGVLGALDPYLYRNQQLLANMQGTDPNEINEEGEAVFDFGNERDLRHAVLKAYTQTGDSDDETDSVDSYLEEQSSEGENDVAQISFSGDSGAAAQNGGELSVLNETDNLKPRTTYLSDTTDPSNLSALASKRQEAWRTGRAGALWGNDSRRTSYMVKSDIYDSSQKSNPEQQFEAVETANFKDPFNGSMSGDSSPGKLPFNVINVTPPMLPQPPPPPPPPLHFPPNVTSSVSGNTRSGGGPPIKRTMSGRINLTSAVAQSIGIPSVNVGTHKRAATAAPAFRKTLSKQDVFRHGSRNSLSIKRSRRKSSIRDVAQQIHVLSQVPSQTRRKSNMYTIQPSPKSSIAGKYFPSYGGQSNNMPAGIGNIYQESRDRSSSAQDPTGNLVRERRRSTIGGGPHPQLRRSEKPNNGARLRVVLPSANGGPGQAFEGAAAIAAAAANTQVQEQQGLEQADTESYLSTTASAILPSFVKKSSEFYPRVAITALARVLADGSMAVHQKTSVDAINKIFRSLGKDRPMFLPIVIPRLIHVIQTTAKSGQLSREPKISQLLELGKLIEIVKLDIYPYVPAIFELVHEIWNIASKVETLGLVLTLVETLTSSMLRPHVPNLLEDLLGVLHSERDQLRSEDSKFVLAVIARLGGALDEHLYLVIPTITALVDSTLIPTSIRGLAIQVLTRIVQTSNISEYATLIMHPLLHALDDCRFWRISQLLPEDDGQKKKQRKQKAASSMSDPLGLMALVMRSRGLGNVHSSNSYSDSAGAYKYVQDELEMLLVLVEILTALVYRLEEEYAVFAPVVGTALQGAVEELISPLGVPLDDQPALAEDMQAVEHYFGLVLRVLKGQRLEKPSWYSAHIDHETEAFLNDLSNVREEDPAITLPQTKNMDLTLLKATWHTAQISTELEWMEWMRRLALQLLRHSPKSALQSCFPLAQVCEPLTSELFNAAFLSCWDSLESDTRENLVSQLELALKAPKIPKDMLQTLLNLAEFMEHDNKPLPIDMHILSDVALKCQANAKALRFKELEFRIVPEDCIEKLITINNNLEQREAAAGVVLYARSNFAETKDVQPQWYERLQAWDEALQAYEVRSQELERARLELSEGSQLLSIEQLRVNVGRLRCLNRVGGWNTVLSVLEEKWSELVEHDIEIGKRYTKHRRETQSDDIPVLPRYKDSSEHPADVEMSISERKRSMDELSDVQTTVGQPVGVLIRNRSHASSIASVHAEEEDNSSAFLFVRGAWSAGSGDIKQTKEIRTRDANSNFERSTSQDIHSARELVHLFGGDRNNLESRIQTVQTFSTARGAPSTIVPTTVLDATAAELKGYYSGLGGISGAIVMRPEQDANTELQRKKRRQSTDGTKKDPALEEKEAEEKQESKLRSYAQSLATLGAFAAFALGKWDEMAKYSGFLNEERTDGNFLKVVQHLHKNNLDQAQRHLDKVHQILDKELSSLVVESYSRAYPRLIEVQHMVELQEVLEYKRLAAGENSDEAKLFLNRLRRVWASRLQGVQNTASVLMPILAYRSIVIDPIEDLETWLNFAKVARKENLLNLSLQALMRLGIGSVESNNESFFAFNEERTSIVSLHHFQPEITGYGVYLNQEDLVSRVMPHPYGATRSLKRRNFKVKPRVAFAYIKYIWAIGDRLEAIHRLKRLRLVLKRSIQSSKDFSARNATSGAAASNFLNGRGNLSADSHVFSLENELKLSSVHSTLEEDENEDAESRRVSVLDLTQLEKLRRDMEDKEKSDGSRALEETEDDLEEHLFTDLQALDIDPRQFKRMRRLLVQCDCKLGSWLLAVHDEQVLAVAAQSYEDQKEKLDEEISEIEEGEDKYVQKNDSAASSPRGSSSSSGRRPKVEPVGSSSSSLLMGSSTKARAKPTRMSITATIERGSRPFPSQSQYSNGTVGSSPRESMEDCTGNFQLHVEKFRRRTFDQVLSFYKEATHLDPESYKAWHAWALANVRASEEVGLNGEVSSLQKKSVKSLGGGGEINFDEVFPPTKRGNQTTNLVLHPCVVPAVRAFFRSISLGRLNNADVLQDILRLLSLWFSNFENEEVEAAMREGFNTLEIESWLAVIPQLIARLKREDDLVCDLLVRIGTAHPQKLIYPLTVASKSDNEARSSAAKNVMRHMRNSFPELVDEALVVSRELIRVAVLWHEKWYNRLEEASGYYFSASRDIDQMIRILKPLHQEMEAGPETPHEMACVQKYGLGLQEAAEWLYKYINSESKDTSYLDQAWDLYYNVFCQIKKQLKSSKHLELRNVSHLMSSTNMLLVVPGTYQAGRPVVRIAGFDPSVRIIPSKQRPRVLTMQGSDGYAHTFLLKGNEDLRMDERVMQLFGLVRGLLQQDSTTSKLRLEIQRYAVVPLSSSSGIVEWVPACDTLNQLIKSYRESRQIPVHIENKLMSDLAQGYDSCTVMQKVEAFEYALNQTSGRDLAKILWLKSPNSEVWIDRRTTYTRSLAAMSMVGYILGLGDRHPSNLMLERSSGRILHIDFGDCFEVTMHRNEFPERVPFRLTRMLINAMEASGIDGNFRHTCRAVMRVLRENHESILTILQAFVYDPLVSWRILQPNESRRGGEDRRSTSQQAQSLQSTTSLPSPHPSSLDVVVEREVQGGRNHGDGRSIDRRSLSSSQRKSIIGSSQRDQSFSEQPSRYETMNKRAVDVINRIKAKLTGKDFTNESDPDLPLPIKDQVSNLIKQATSHENLAQHYRGWSATW